MTSTALLSIFSLDEIKYIAIEMMYRFLRLPVKLKKMRKFWPLVFKKVIYPESMKPLLILYTIMHLGKCSLEFFFC